MFGAVDTRRRINSGLKHTLEILTKHIRVQCFSTKFRGCCNFLNGDPVRLRVIRLNVKPVGDRVIIELFGTACSLVDDVAVMRCEFYFRSSSSSSFFSTETSNVSSQAKFPDELDERNCNSSSWFNYATQNSRQST